MRKHVPVPDAPPSSDSATDTAVASAAATTASPSCAMPTPTPIAAGSAAALPSAHRAPATGGGAHAPAIAGFAAAGANAVRADDDDATEHAHAGCAIDAARVSQRVHKYWEQRYRLFHRFDDGIVLDEELWYSVTPEKIARHIARRFARAGCRCVVDLFSGAGGNAIQFAAADAFTLGVEICADRIAMARTNAAVYGVANMTEFVCADVRDVLRMLEGRAGGVGGAGLVDGVFLSPPWGGPEYCQGGDGWFDMTPFKGLIEAALRVCGNVGVLVPRTADEDQIYELFGACEVEQNYLSGKLKTKTIYFGEVMLSRAEAAEVVEVEDEGEGVRGEGESEGAGTKVGEKGGEEGGTVADENGGATEDAGVKKKRKRQRNRSKMRKKRKAEQQ